MMNLEEDLRSHQQITAPEGDHRDEGGLQQQQRENRHSSPLNMVKVYQDNQKGLAIGSEKNLNADQATTWTPVEPFKYAGYLGCVLSSIALSLAILCVKLLPVEDCISEKAKASFFRGLFMMLFCGLTIVQQGLSLTVPRGEYLVNLARAVLGGFNVLLAYISIQFISIGERSAVSYLYCIWTSLLGYILLKEPLKITLLVAIPVSFLGVILIAMPSLIVEPEEELLEPLAPPHNPMNSTYDTETTRPESVEVLCEYYFEHRWIGILTSIVGSITSSMSTIVLKFRKKTPIVTCSFYLGLAMVLVSIGAQAIVGFAAMPSTGLEWFLHLCIGFLSYLAQCLFQWALQFVPAGTFSTILSIEIVTGYFLSVVFLHEPVLCTSLVGSALIVSVVILLVFNDRLVGCFHQKSTES